MQLYIPEKIKVGFQKRDDTLDSKLGFIIYYDKDGKLKNEKRWNTWRNESIKPLTLENKPFKNANLHKGIEYAGTSFSDGKSTLRIYDNRGFEYEISFDNFVAISLNNEISKGEIIGEFVYAFAGTKLILLPVNSEEYKKALQSTKNKDTDIKEDDLIPGSVYYLKKTSYMKGIETCIYIGKYNFNHSISTLNFPANGKEEHIFYKDNGFEIIDVKNIGQLKHSLEESELKTYTEKYIGSVIEKKIEKIYFSHINFNDKEIHNFIKNGEINSFFFGSQDKNCFNNIGVVLEPIYQHRNEYSLSKILMNTSTFKIGVRNKKYSIEKAQEDIYWYYVSEKNINTSKETFNEIVEHNKGFKDFGRVKIFDDESLANAEYNKSIEIFKKVLSDWKANNIGILTYKFEDGKECYVVNRVPEFDI